MNKKELVEHIKKCFEKNYRDSYKLVKIKESEVCLTYVIVDHIIGIICEFKVAKDYLHKIFSAVSYEGLLTNQVEIRIWSSFMADVESAN